MDTQSIVTNSLDGTTAPGMLDGRAPEFIWNPVCFYTTKELWWWWELPRSKQCWDLSSHTLVCPVPHTHWGAQNLNTTERLKGILTGANISIHKKWKKLLWRVEGVGKEQVFNFLRGLRKRKSCGQKWRDSFNTLKTPVNLEGLCLWNRNSTESLEKRKTFQIELEGR